MLVLQRRTFFDHHQWSIFLVKKIHLLLHYMATIVANIVSNMDTIKIKKESVKNIKLSFLLSFSLINEAA